MKNIIKILLIAFLGFMLVSCEKDEDKAIIGDASTSSLSVDKTSIVLDQDNADSDAITFSWINPNYGIPLGVKNKLEIAQKGTNFSNPHTYVLLDGTLSKTFINGDFNTLMLEAGMVPGTINEIEVRMISEIESYSSVISNIIEIEVTPYLTEFPSFYIVGEASAVGWNATSAQMLNKSDNISKIYTYLENGKSFRFLGQKDWNPINYSLDSPGMSDSYKYFKTWSSNLTPSPNENMQFTGTTGVYKIMIDAEAATKSINITASPIATWNPVNLYIVGSINGWNAGAAVPMTNLGDGKYEIQQNLPDGSQFKFIGQLDWGDLEWGNLSTSGNSGYLGPKGDNDNVTFDGGGQDYKIEVDIKMGIYKITLM